MHKNHTAGLLSGKHEGNTQPVASSQKASHAGFFRSSGIFIIMTFLSSVFEVGFYGVTSRLEADWVTFNALFNIFFIIIVPLTSIQLVVSREVAARLSSGDISGAGAFTAISLRTVLFVAGIILVLGSVFSPLIARFLKIDRILPVILLLVVMFCYSPFPIFYGAVQGMKRFFTLGLLQFSWGLFKFMAVVTVIYGFAGGLDAVMSGIILAVLLCVLIAWLPARKLLAEPRTPMDRAEAFKAYRLVIPIMMAMFCVIALKNSDIIFAKRLLDVDSARAYTCAARVGSAFFTLSGIIMVMFPHVSEEHSRSGNPIVFLFKSLIMTIALALTGILIAWAFPGIIMRIITFGDTIPGAIPLIRLIGLAVTPVPLVYIMANYLLAKTSAHFLPLLAAGLGLQILFIHLMHNSAMQFLTGIAIANWITCLAVLAAVVVEHKKTSIQTHQQILSE